MKRACAAVLLLVSIGAAASPAEANVRHQSPLEVATKRKKKHHKVTLSPACNDAMAALARGGFNLTDEQELAAQRATLDACQSKAEWVLGASQYQGSDEHEVVIGNTKPTAVWKAFCQGNEDAPACAKH